MCKCVLSCTCGTSTTLMLAYVIKFHNDNICLLCYSFAMLRNPWFTTFHLSNEAVRGSHGFLGHRRTLMSKFCENTFHCSLWCVRVLNNEPSVLVEGPFCYYLFCTLVYCITLECSFLSNKRVWCVKTRRTLEVNLWPEGGDEHWVYGFAGPL